MKRFLTLALLATAMSAPAFAAGGTDGNTTSGSGTGMNSSSDSSYDSGSMNSSSDSMNSTGNAQDTGAANSSDQTSSSSAMDSGNGTSSNSSMDSSASSNPAPDTSNSANNSSGSSSSSTTASAGAAIRAENLGHNDVVLIQQALRQEGLYNGSADGIWGPRTASALMQFQQQNRLGATGQLNQNTLNELGVELGSDSQGTNSNNQSTINSSQGVGSSSNPGTANTY